MIDRASFASLSAHAGGAAGALVLFNGRIVGISGIAHAGDSPTADPRCNPAFEVSRRLAAGVQ
jgi:hypothetical protein